MRFPGGPGAPGLDAAHRRPCREPPRASVTGCTGVLGASRAGRPQRASKDDAPTTQNEKMGALLVQGVTGREQETPPAPRSQTPVMGRGVLCTRQGSETPADSGAWAGPEDALRSPLRGLSPLCWGKAHWNHFDMAARQLEGHPSRGGAAPPSGTFRGQRAFCAAGEHLTGARCLLRLRPCRGRPARRWPCSLALSSAAAAAKSLQSGPTL